MTPRKPVRRWEALVPPPLVHAASATVAAISWFLARQAAAVELHADPADITVRLAPEAT